MRIRLMLAWAAALEMCTFYVQSIAVFGHENSNKNFVEANHRASAVLIRAPSFRLWLTQTFFSALIT